MLEFVLGVVAGLIVIAVLAEFLGRPRRYDRK